jgi:Tfp pilus assembly protein, ATPase PilM
LTAAYLSFDLGTRNIHAVVGQTEGNTVRILRSASIGLPKGVLSDGLITNKEVLTSAMQEVLASLNTSTKDALITFNSNSVIIREFEVPSGNEQELEAMIKNEIIQFFGMTDTDLVEYRKIGETETGGMKKVKVRAAVMNKEIAHAYYDLLDSLKLKPVALDIHANVISKIFNEQTAINNDLSNNYIILDIGYSGTMIYLISQGSLNFFRSISFGGKAVDRLLAGLFALSEEKAEEKKLEFLSDKQERIASEAGVTERTENRSLAVKKKGHTFVIKKKGLTENMEEPVSDSAENTVEGIRPIEQGKVFTKEEALAAVKPLYGELLEEIRKVMQFFANRSGSKDLSQIYLIGGGASLTGIPEYLSQGLGLKVDRLQMISNIQYIDHEQAPGDYVNASAALIRL